MIKHDLSSIVHYSYYFLFKVVDYNIINMKNMFKFQTVYRIL